jgi:hypothetical protein
MARACAKCNYYDPSGSRETCPDCQAPLRFTLLPPAGATPDALPLAGSGTSGSVFLQQGRGSGSTGSPGPFPGLMELVFRYRLVMSVVVVPILLLLSLAFGVNLTGPSVKDKFDRLKVGMDVDEVRAIMEPPVHHRRMPVRHLSLFDDLPERGPATLTWEENGATLTLEFRNGELVSKSQQALR